jgi:CMP-2-keto-3-deoxyoctulosonic acid synthetase
VERLFARFEASRLKRQALHEVLDAPIVVGGAKDAVRAVEILDELKSARRAL